MSSHSSQSVLLGLYVYMNCRCVRETETYAECSRVLSIQGCRYTLHLQRCTELHCDSYMCGCSQGPMSPKDMLPEAHKNKCTKTHTVHRVCNKSQHTLVQQHYNAPSQQVNVSLLGFTSAHGHFILSSFFSFIQFIQTRISLVIYKYIIICQMLPQ